MVSGTVINPVSLIVYDQPAGMNASGWRRSREPEAVPIGMMNSAVLDSGIRAEPKPFSTDEETRGGISPLFVTETLVPDPQYCGGQSQLSSDTPQS
jgi:hypothetical protein